MTCHHHGGVSTLYRTILFALHYGLLDIFGYIQEILLERIFQDIWQFFIKISFVLPIDKSRHIKPRIVEFNCFVGIKKDIDLDFVVKTQIRFCSSQ